MTAVLEAQPQIEVELSTVELSARLELPRHQLDRWIRDGVLKAGGIGRDNRAGGRNGWRWSPAQQATALAVTAAWRQGFDRIVLRRVAAACAIALDGRGKEVRAEWPDLIIVTNPTTAADLEPLDRHTLVVQL
jgi:hypothetical protein